MRNEVRDHNFSLFFQNILSNSLLLFVVMHSARVETTVYRGNIHHSVTTVSIGLSFQLF